jgi:hypothetical protein
MPTDPAGSHFGGVPAHWEKYQNAPNPSSAPALVSGNGRCSGERCRRSIRLLARRLYQRPVSPS